MYLAEKRNLASWRDAQAAQADLERQVALAGGAVEDQDTFLVNRQDGTQYITAQATVRIADPKAVKGFTMLKVR